MVQWTCPACQRRFGRRQQPHECEPVLELDDYLTRQPAAQRPIYRKVLKVLRQLGELDVDPVEVGLLLKHGFTFCELRPKRDAVELSFKLSRPLANERFQRVIAYATHRTAYFVRLKAAKDVDAEVVGWITEAYAEASQGVALEVARAVPRAVRRPLR